MMAPNPRCFLSGGGGEGGGGVGGAVGGGGGPSGRWTDSADRRYHGP